jgi:hypothetical protein
MRVSASSPGSTADALRRGVAAAARGRSEIPGVHLVEATVGRTADGTVRYRVVIEIDDETRGGPDVSR